MRFEIGPVCSRSHAAEAESRLIKSENCCMEDLISRSSSSIGAVKSEADTEFRPWFVPRSFASSEAKRMNSVPIVCINAVTSALIFVPGGSSLTKVCATFAAGTR